MRLQRLRKPSVSFVWRISLILLPGILGFLVITTYTKDGPSLASHASEPSRAIMQNNRARVEAELITIEPHGFEPAEITRPQGRFLLGLDNRSGLEDIQLQLERADGGKVSALETRDRRLSWRKEVDLAPGRYVIRERNHVNWICLINITPH